MLLEETKTFRDKVDRVRHARLQIAQSTLALGRDLELIKLAFAGDDPAFHRWLQRECGLRPPSFELLAAAHRAFRDVEAIERFDAAAILLLAGASPAAQQRARRLARRGVLITFARARHLAAKFRQEKQP